MNSSKQFWIAVLVALFTIFLFTSYKASSEIKNGYAPEISYTKDALSSLLEFLQNEELTKLQRNAVKGAIKSIMEHIAYYELTEQLLDHFHQVAPEIYRQIDTIVDLQGRPVDVYIKFVSWNGTEVKARGTTYICQAKNDEDLYISEYGEGTVSVKIWTEARSLLILAHELGHVYYQVPNLASYVNFYNLNYDCERLQDSNCIGHNSKDPSGKCARNFEKKFIAQLRDFHRKSKERLPKPTFIFSQIKSEWKLNKQT